MKFKSHFFRKLESGDKVFKLVHEYIGTKAEILAGKSETDSWIFKPQNKKVLEKLQRALNDGKAKRILRD